MSDISETSDSAAPPLSISADWPSPTELHLHLDIREGFHINAHEPSSGMTATMVAVSGEAAPMVQSIDYPSGESRALAFAGQAIRIYDKRATIIIRFSSVPTADVLRLVISYQACTDSACLAPAKLAVEFAPER
jgi:hypothetical protein